MIVSAERVLVYQGHALMAFLGEVHLYQLLSPHRPVTPPFPFPTPRLEFRSLAHPPSRDHHCHSSRQQESVLLMS